MDGSDQRWLPLGPDEIERLRAETPACRRVVHFNHAGDSPSPDPVVEAVVAHLRREAEIGGYEAANEASERRAAVYRSVADLVGAAPDEIAIVENATRAWDMLFYSVPFQLGDRILTSASEYGSNAIPYLQVAKRGVSVEVIPSRPDGATDPAALRDMLDERVRLVGITHMPTNGGLLQPAEAIGRVLRESGSDAIYLLDACQTAGQLRLDVGEIGCHALSATSRKYLRGPRGVGFLYVRRDLAERLEPPFLDIHAAEWVAADRYELAPGARRFENWESCVAGALGFGVAVDYALAIGLDRIWSTVAARAAGLRERLACLPGVHLHDLGNVKGAIVTFSVDGVSAADVKTALAARDINVSVSTTSSTRYDMDARHLTELVRASVHYVTTDAECDTLATAIESIAG